VRIVAELRSAQPLDASELGRRVGLHANTVRWHLGILAEAGIVQARPQPRATPGRPRVVYALRETGTGAQYGEYRLLAGVLASALAGQPDAAAASVDAGRAVGRRLTAKSEHGAEPSEEGAVASVVGLLAAHGFEPRAAGWSIEMRRCPFRDLAEAHPDVVCGAHRGLLDGALAALRPAFSLAALEVFPRPGVCIARIEPAADRAPTGAS
jgi:predicted ArsR family transcriptional regulator